MIEGWNSAVSAFLGETAVSMPAADPEAAAEPSRATPLPLQTVAAAAPAARHPSPHGYRGLATAPHGKAPSQHAAGTGPKASDAATAQLEALLERQRTECPAIVAELNKHRRKVSHWAWWVFPTELPGASEPPPATAVTKVRGWPACYLLAKGNSHSSFILASSPGHGAEPASAIPPGVAAGPRGGGQSREGD